MECTAAGPGTPADSGNPKKGGLTRAPGCLTPLAPGPNRPLAVQFFPDSLVRILFGLVAGGRDKGQTGGGRPCPDTAATVIQPLAGLSSGPDRTQRRRIAASCRRGASGLGPSPAVALLCRVAFRQPHELTT